MGTTGVNNMLTQENTTGFSKEQLHKINMEVINYMSTEYPNLTDDDSCYSMYEQLVELKILAKYGAIITKLTDI